jgi:uncharacterized protein YciI
MLYAWIGFLKPGAGPIAQSVQEMATDFLSQPLIDIRMVGPLLDASGERAGMMMIFERDNRESAESFVGESPYLRASLYDDHRLYEYQDGAA